MCLDSRPIFPGYWRTKLPKASLPPAPDFSRSFGVAEEIVTRSAEETTNCGREFSNRLKPPVLVLLAGDLGTGKPTLPKGSVCGLGVATEDHVTRATFTLVHVY